MTYALIRHVILHHTNQDIYTSIINSYKYRYATDWKFVETIYSQYDRKFLRDSMQYCSIWDIYKIRIYDCSKNKQVTCDTCPLKMKHFVILYDQDNRIDSIQYCSKCFSKFDRFYNKHDFVVYNPRFILESFGLSHLISS
jgi:hypothetical protein